MKKKEGLKQFIEMYPTYFDNKPFLLPVGWSKKLAEDVIKQFDNLINEKIEKIQKTNFWETCEDYFTPEQREYFIAILKE